MVCALLSLAGTAFAGASVADASYSEGSFESGLSYYLLHVTVSDADAYDDCTVNYHFADGTATVADNDYAGGAAVITTDAPSLYAYVAVNGDEKYEPDETFSATLDSVKCTPTGGGGAVTIPLDRATATITVQNDDPKPQVVSVSDPTVVEGDTGSTAQLGFNVSFDVGGRCDFDYTTADGSATAPADYTADSGHATFASSPSGVIPVPVTGDDLFEGDETVKFDISNVTCVATNSEGDPVDVPVTGDFEGLGTIIDDETVCDLPNSIRGTAGNDVLRGSDNDDVICGLGGNDKLYGFGGDGRHLRRPRRRPDLRRRR